ncbi:MAG: dihydrolipoyl dehydrogenase [Candidatus Omnitrophica bacterium]|nr:dihydrolipoyl dehydrogenase [Candidatus Omnitrophota bacterium]
MDNYDVVIIGGGPAGYPCAIRCSQNGLKTALIEKDQLGGTCLNRGCIPTKSLFELTNQVEKSTCDGIIKNTSFDWEKSVEWIKSKVITRLRTGLGFLLKVNGVELLNGEGKIKEPGVVEVNGKELRTKNIVIATGSSPSVPSIFANDEKLITSDSIWALKKLPESITIIGGGFIGCEFASILNSFGLKVSVYEMTEGLLPGKDREIVQAMEKIFVQRGINIACNTRVSNLSDTGTEKALWSTGRRANSENFSNLGLKMEKGIITTDEKMKTNIGGIYAIGDINGKYPLAYIATREGEVLADVLAGRDVKMDYKNIPDAIFTSPVIASCGLTEEQALSEGRKIKIGRCPYQAIGRAYASGKTTGLTKIIADADTHKILGIHIIGQEATELIHIAAVAISKEMTAGELTEIYFCHPTFSESILEAVLEIEDRPIHLPPKKSVKK